MEKTKMSIKWMDKKIVAYLHNGILLSNSCNMNESQNNYVSEKAGKNAYCMITYIYKF